MNGEYKYYSIILKGCVNPEKLGSSLEKTLLRGRLAIKMALDNIPSVIIYKGNVDNIVTVFKTFADEYAAITVLPDGVPPALPLTKKYRNFLDIRSDIQPLLTAVPDNLWLGEAIHRIVPATFLDETGALVISSHAIYFIDKPAGDTHCRWLIIPYNQINTPLKINETDCLLTISYQDAAGQQNDDFTLPAELLAAVQTAIEQAKEAKRYVIRLKAFCSSCDYAEETILSHSSADIHCPNCKQLLQRLLIT